MRTEHDPNAILVIKHGALGDIIQGLDAFASLRDGNPKSHIAIMTTPAFSSLFAQMPWFDEVITDPRASALNLAETLRIRTVLRRSWHCIIDMQCSRRTARYYQFYVPRQTRWIGTAKNCSDPLPDFTGVNNRDRMLFAAKCAGGTDSLANLDWLTHPTDAPENKTTQSPKGQFVVFVAGCSPHRPEKRWPAKNFADVGRVLSRQGYKIVLVGTAADADIIKQVETYFPEAQNLCGQTNLSQLTRLFASADFVLGNDTGPIFLAAKSGTPTLVLMGSATVPEAMRPIEKNAGWIHHATIESITPKQVVAKLQAMLQNQR